MKIRYQLPDKLKAIAIILVLLFHLTPEQTPQISSNLATNSIETVSPFLRLLRSLLHCERSFCMPLFFMLSGLFAKHFDLTFFEYIKKQFNRLIVPYVIFGTISISYYFIHNILYDTPTDSYLILKNFAFGTLPVLWFLPTLFFTTILYYILKRIFKSSYILTFICLLIAIFSIHNWGSDGSPNGVNSIIPAFVAIFYFSLGKSAMLLYESHNNDINNIYRKKTMRFFLGTTLLFIVCLLDMPCSMHVMRFDGGIIQIFSALIGICGIFLLAGFIPYCTITKWVSANTLILFGTHIVSYYMMIDFLEICLTIPYPQKISTEFILINLILISFAFCMSIAYKFLLNKIFPSVFK